MLFLYARKYGSLCNKYHRSIQIYQLDSCMHFLVSSTKKQSWWQSQSGVENVTIQLDLEAEFYFTYLYMRFKTFRPAALLVERSYDYGQTWKVNLILFEYTQRCQFYTINIKLLQIYRYFAYNCTRDFGYAPKGPQNNLTVPYCDEHYSSVTPFTNGEVSYENEK